MPQKSLENHKVQLFLSILVVLAFTLALEGASHLIPVKVGGSLFIPEAKRNFRMRPGAGAWVTIEGQNFVKINSNGYRDLERNLDSRPGTFRVAMLGDSVVAGFQVARTETFTQVVERRLASKFPGVKIEVLNFGVNSYNLAQQYITLRDDVLAYHPNLVVNAISITNGILNSTHDTAPNEATYPYFLEKAGHLELYDPQPKTEGDLNLESKLLDFENHSNLILLALEGQRALKGVAQFWWDKFTAKPSLPEHFYDRSMYPPREAQTAKAWRISEGTIKLMNELCRSHSTPYWMLTMDVPGQVDPDLTLREKFRDGLQAPSLYYPDSRLIHLAETEHIPHLQSSLALGEYASRTGQCVHGFFNTPRNTGHLNAIGHRVVGELLSEAILRAMESGNGLDQPQLISNAPSSEKAIQRSGRNY